MVQYDFIAQINQGILFNYVMQIDPTTELIGVFEKDNIEFINNKFSNETNSSRYINTQITTNLLYKYEYNLPDPIFFKFNFSEINVLTKNAKVESTITIMKRTGVNSLDFLLGENNSLNDINIEIIRDRPIIDTSGNVLSQINHNFNLHLKELASAFTIASKGKSKAIMSISNDGVQIEPLREGAFSTFKLRNFAVPLRIDNRQTVTETDEGDEIIHNKDCFYCVTLDEVSIKVISKLNKLDSKSSIVQVFIRDDNFIRFDVLFGTTGCVKLVIESKPGIESVQGKKTRASKK